MLALMNPKIVAQLNTLAASWMAVALEQPGNEPAPKEQRAPARKRRAKSKT